jgi:hypothetical protein
MIASTVYILCAVTSILCAAMLLRAWLGTRSRLLLWSGVCFLWFAANNMLLFVDLEVLPDTDLALARSGTAFVGAATLLLALVWESR